MHEKRIIRRKSGQGSGIAVAIITWLDIAVDWIPGRIFGSRRPSRPVQQPAFLHIITYYVKLQWRSGIFF